MEGIKLAKSESNGELIEEDGVITIRKAKDLDAFKQGFVQAMGQHRHWNREEKMQVPA